MSSRTPNTPTTDDRPDGGDRPATDRAATASDRLWAALHARPGSTAERLSADAGIGRSTAAKILARWVTDGTVERDAGEAKKSASRFAIAPTTDDTTPVTPPDDSSGISGPQGAADGVPHDEPNTDIDGENAETVAADDTTTPVTTEGADDAGTATHEPVTGADGRDPTTEETGEAGPGPSQASTATLEANRSGGTEREASDTAPDATGPVVSAKAPRLAPGALHGMVEDYLREHPGEEFGPTKIGHDLGRSPGAISNALDRLVHAGYAVRTKDQPKRYALAPVADDPAESGAVRSAGTEEPAAQES